MADIRSLTRGLHPVKKLLLAILLVLLPVSLAHAQSDTMPQILDEPSDAMKSVWDKWIAAFREASSLISLQALTHCNVSSLQGDQDSALLLASDPDTLGFFYFCVYRPADGASPILQIVFPNEIPFSITILVARDGTLFETANLLSGQTTSLNFLVRTLPPGHYEVLIRGGYDGPYGHSDAYEHAERYLQFTIDDCNIANPCDPC